MEDSRSYWENIYCRFDESPKETVWLDRYGDILGQSPETPVIDLGCGCGADSLYLLKRGFPVISCDFSPTALEKLSYLDSRAVTRCFDMSEGLPFGDSEAHVVIADLSLHYFDREGTANILREIFRILDGEGYLLCRLNSVNDIHFGAGDGEEVEENYFNIKGHYKRFFDRSGIESFFDDWVISYCVEKVLYRFGHPKTAWELALRKGTDEDICLGEETLKRIRTVTNETVEGLTAVLKEEEVIRYLPFHTSPSAHDVRKFLESILKPDSLVWIIRREGEIIGLIDLLSLKEKSASLAYFLAKPFWRRGILTAALKAVIQYGAAHGEIECITAPVVSRNEPSRKVLEKHRFRFKEKMDRPVNFDGEEDQVLLYELRL